MSKEKQEEQPLRPAPEQIDPLQPASPAPVIEAPVTEEGEEVKRDAHTGPGSKFHGSPPASVVPPGKKSGVY